MRYRISLWDHEPEPAGNSLLDDSVQGCFSADLAAEHLEGPSTNLGPMQLRQALRVLRSHWSDEVIFVEREYEGQMELF